MPSRTARDPSGTTLLGSNRYNCSRSSELRTLKFSKALEWAQKATRIPNCHYWPFAHRVAALGHMQRTKELRTAVAELLQRRPGFSQSFARKRLFYVKKPAQLDVYIEGLRRAGIPA
jgi:adenylate cyclase